MAKQILIATGIFPPDIGGPAIYAQKLADEFSNEGIGVKVVTYGADFKENSKYGICGISRNWPMGLRQLMYFWKILFLAKKSEAILALDSLGAGLPAVLAGKIFRKKTIVRMGGDFLWEKYVESGGERVTMAEFYGRKLNRKYPLLNYLITLVLGLADYTAFTTNFQKNLFIAHYGIPEGRSVVVSNVFEKGEGGTVYQRSGGFKTILWAGRFIKLKNLNLLLRVFKQLLERDKNLLLELAGDGPELQKIKMESEKLEISGKVLFPGPLSRNALAEEIKKSYFCVLPSLSDISPNFILECLSLNKAVILTRETGIKDQFPGLLYIDPQNESDLLEAALKLLNAGEYGNYQKFIFGIRYRKTWPDLAEEYLRLLRL